MTEGVCALILVAGRGERFGSVGPDGLPQNKVFADLLGRPLLAWTLQAFAECDAVDAVVLVGREDELPRLREISEQYGGGKVREIGTGGTTRQESVYRGLHTDTAGRSEYVLVHDGARPCLLTQQIEQVLTGVRAFGAATAATPLADTLVRGDTEGKHIAEDIPRDGVWAIQTPQGFRFRSLLAAHEEATKDAFPATDDAGLIRRRGGSVRLVPTGPQNLKVTQREDLELAGAILQQRHFPLTPLLASPQNRGIIVGMNVAANLRIGHGYDIHRFADGRKLYLGGVEFADAPRGLLGHSDADALLHAVCDALLGAAGLGDIGKLFPPSDPAHKDRPSVEFVREVHTHLVADGWQIGNIDVTVLAETPKIGPRAAEMRAVIAHTLQITVEQISIKATTNEGLGAIGRGEGIAVHATALLYR